MQLNPRRKSGVFYWDSGGCGFTYGHNAIMQFHKEGDTESAYGVEDNWEVALNAPGEKTNGNDWIMVLDGIYFYLPSL